MQADLSIVCAACFTLEVEPTTSRAVSRAIVLRKFFLQSYVRISQSEGLNIGPGLSKFCRTGSVQCEERVDTLIDTRLISKIPNTRAQNLDEQP